MSRFKSCYVPLLLLTFAAAATAEDFTFTVPYSAKGVPADIKTLRVTCAALDAGGGTVGVGDHDFKIPAGGDTMSLRATIKFNAQAGKQASAATRYKCSLYEPFGKLIAQKAGDPSRLEVEGPIKR
jgi:hypothetical protein